MNSYGHSALNNDQSKNIDQWPFGPWSIFLAWSLLTSRSLFKQNGLEFICYWSFISHAENTLLI